MNQFVLALGSNQGDRLQNLCGALRLLEKLGTLTKVSSAVENPPWLPAGAPMSWCHFFLNSVVLLKTELSAQDLLLATQNIELQLGRTPDHLKWSPRSIDIDLLFELSGQTHHSENLSLPHPEWQNRNFVLSPLAQILPHYRLDNGQTVLERYRLEKNKLPHLMAIVNVTPDSFSQKTGEINTDSLLENLQDLFQSGVAYIDLGAESTRPGAQALSYHEEWSRLSPLLEEVRHLKKDYPFTKISVDTHHPQTAQRLLDYKVDMLNDVRGLADQEMREVATHFNEVVVMHSLTVPANKSVTWPIETQPVNEMHHWIETRMNSLKHIPADKIIWDPGFGFGKTPAQSLLLIHNFEKFNSIPMRSLVGHSRKSFMNLWTEKPFSDRDPETLAVSKILTDKGADILRVHNIPAHQDFLRTQLLLESEHSISSGAFKNA